jgi:hypothetical protein
MPARQLTAMRPDAATPCLQSQIGRNRHPEKRRSALVTGHCGGVRGCPLGTGQDRCEWHGSGTAGEDERGCGVAVVGSARAIGEALQDDPSLVGKPQWRRGRSSWALSGV